MTRVVHLEDESPGTLPRTQEMRVVHRMQQRDG
jgi:hypothetical protein